ncbi:MAG: rRNA maturation RNase YbeY [Candidatus Spechtbacterales bacterium]
MTTRVVCEVINETDRAVDERFICRCVEAAVVARPPSDESVAISVVLVGPERMRVLKREHYGVDEVTDVLSFAAPVEERRTQQNGQEGVYLGEVVVCPAFWEGRVFDATAVSRGARWEFCHTLVHGTLHLLGTHHEHSSDALTDMHALEEDIIDSLL